jgi:hypothetical protein
MTDDAAQNALGAYNFGVDHLCGWPMHRAVTVRCGIAEDDDASALSKTLLKDLPPIENGHHAPPFHPGSGWQTSWYPVGCDGIYQ